MTLENLQREKKQLEEKINNQEIYYKKLIKNTEEY